MGGGIRQETEAYAQTLLAEVEAHAATEGHEAFLEIAFTGLVLESLEEQGYWPDFQLAHLTRKGMGMHAWGLDPNARILYLCIADFEYTNTANRFTKSDRTSATKRLQRLFQKASSGSLELQEHSPLLDLAEVIREGSAFDSVRCWILTNKVAADSSVERSDTQVPVEVRVWDLESIRRSHQSGERLEPIQIDVIDRLGEGLACLPSPKAHPQVKTLLAFVPAPLLAAIYHEYGPRLLERNVRSFLMARGKVNQGIRDTLRFEPERFLAYNNGLTATASEVRLNWDGGVPRVDRIVDLQIVNGGQTTASIAAAARDSSVDLDDVLVQMKLAVVAPEILDELVPSISRYANRQNAVQDSDLSANLDFLRALERSSRTEWTPTDAGGRPTKWYFERARGSYAVEKSEAGTSVQQAQFAEIYPASQRFGKNDVALFENTWARLPHFVCRGGQKNFAEYLLRLDTGEASELEDVDQHTRDRATFRNLIAKAIIFKAADKVVHRTLGGTYKRSVVAYSLAYLFEHSTSPIDLELVWRSQRISAELQTAIEEIAPQIKDLIIDSAAGRNITEWAKKDDCWKRIRDESIEFTPPPAHPAAPVPSLTSGQPEASGRTLAECIELRHGERLEGPWQSYRRRTWTHTGGTDVPAPSGHGNLELYTSRFTDADGRPRTKVVAVDFAGATITPLEEFDEQVRRAIELSLGEFA